MKKFFATLITLLYFLSSSVCYAFNELYHIKYVDKAEITRYRGERKRRLAQKAEDRNRAGQAEFQDHEDRDQDKRDHSGKRHR